MFGRKHKPVSKRRQKRRPTFQALSDRRLMAADISLSGGTLEINADHHDERITVENVLQTLNIGGGRFGSIATSTIKVPRIQVRVEDFTTGGVQTQLFNPSYVQRLSIQGGAGSDVIDVKVSRPATVDGGDGMDWIYGGPLADVLRGGGGGDRIYGRDGDDQLFGDSGNDRLYGDNHNDTLDGGSGSDYLYGFNGDDVLLGGSGTDFLYGGNNNDVLRGGSSRDYLRGESGHDRLIGESGNDDLEGGSGNDVLIGGSGADSMHSSTGYDRYLVIEGQGDVVEDKSSYDARINFANTTMDAFVPLGSDIGWVVAQSRSWASSDVEAVDESFQLLFDVTNNNELLTKANGGDLRFVRFGDVDDFAGNENTSVMGWNSGSDIIVINNAIENGRLMETVIHEIGHHFDEPGENPFVHSFRSAAGWTELAWWDSKVGMTQANDSGWGSWYYSTARADEFARNYGKMNPLEDFATSFTAKIMTDAGLDYFGQDAADVQDRMSARFDVLDDFFASIS